LRFSEVEISLAIHSCDGERCLVRQRVEQ
jgi:hypothetical protein